MLLARVVETSAAVSGTRSRKEKVARIASLLREALPQERAVVARYVAGEMGTKPGIGYRSIFRAREELAPATTASLTVDDVDRRLCDLAGKTGSGSSTARKEGLGALMRAATREEQAFLSALLVGEVRQGALDALVVEAVAAAAGLDAAAVRGAYMLAGEIGLLAEAVLAEGEAALGRFGLTLFRPVLPMLAQTADDANGALATLGGTAALEHKLDGFRVQIHKDDGQVRVYSRALNEVTHAVPEVVVAVSALPARRLVLDGEAIACGPSGRPLPFQDTMKLLAKNRPPGTPPLVLTLFDVLLVDDDTLLSSPARERIAALRGVAPALEVPRLVTADATEAEAFYQRAIAAGHEGIVAKSLDAPYEAGSRGAAWLKVKKVHRLDLVVLAVEWGSGRRKGMLSNLHLGARDGSGGFVMLGKTFKGMTDATLAWQTRELLAREVGRDGHVVHVKPELVAEIAFNDVQRSPHYPGGFALRHARLVRYRDDKKASEADTIDAVRAIARAAGVIAPDGED